MSKEKEGNLALWEAVSATDPAHTRKVNQRGGFTAIDSYYQIRRATEMFGPLGQGWGFSAEYRFEHNLAIAIVSIWYAWKGKKSEPFTVCASNQFKTDKGHVDEDAAKKALTDAITKGLSYLGFSSDVFMGLYDDNKYVAEINAQFRKQEEEEERKREIAELEGEMQLAIESVDDSASYAKIRSHLIPVFLRLKALDEVLAKQYEGAMLRLKAQFGGEKPQGESGAA